MQRLDAPVHDLREAREVGDRADLDAGRLRARRRCRRSRPARSPSSRSPRANSTIPRLVRDRQQRPPDPHLARRRGRPSVCAVIGSAPSCAPREDSDELQQHAARVVRVEAHRPAREQAHRLGQQLVLERRGSASRAPRRASVASGSSIARCRMIGPVSTPSSTKWTVTPNTRTPYSSACSTASTPGKAGSSAGCTLITASGKRARKAGVSSCM